MISKHSTRPRKALWIALDGLQQGASLHAVERSQILIEKVPLASANQNELTDSFGAGCDCGRMRWHSLLVRRCALEPIHVLECHLPTVAPGIHLHRLDSNRDFCRVRLAPEGPP